MLFIDMNTGNTVSASREEAHDSKVEALRALTMYGGAIPGRQGFAVQVERSGGGGMYTIGCGHAVMATCGLAWTRGGARMLWPRLETLYGQIFSAKLEPEQPDQLPWLAVISHPPVVFGHSCKQWLSDFEREFGWAILDERLFA